MRVVFMGTPSFAVPCLKRLIADNYDIPCVFTQPDKPKGRGHRLACPPVKVAAEEAGIVVMQPPTLRDESLAEYLAALQPDFLVVVAYGKILPPEILRVPRFGCINIHASLLPKYRGAAPVQWAIIRGETSTGVTSMLMDEGLDTGDMLINSETNIGFDETAGDLFERLSEMGARVLGDTLPAYANGSLIPVKQSSAEATFAPAISKEICRIDWSLPSVQIHNLIRGLLPFLCAYTELNGKRLKVHKAKPFAYASGIPGEVVVTNNQWIVACGAGTALELLKVQAEGKSVLPAADYLRGCPLPLGTKL